MNRKMSQKFVHLVSSVALGSCLGGCVLEPGADPNEEDFLTETEQALAYGGTSAPVPGRIEAERFDQGGSGVGYFDTTAGNSGGQFRPTESVDIEPATPGGYNVGWIAQGEWLAYGVNVASAGAYDLTASVASLNAAGTFHLEVGGVNVSGPISFTATGGYQTWSSVVIKNVPLPAGQQVIRLVADSSGFNVDWFEFSRPSQTPYAGAPVALPGRIQAENYDLGGAGVAYQDATPGNAGGVYRNDDVDIQAATPSGYNIGWLATGEWLEYTVTSSTAQTYAATFSVAAFTAGGTFHLEANGVDLTGPVTFTASGGWQTYKTVVAPSVSLPVGTTVLRLVSESTGFNVDWFDVAAPANGAILAKTAAAAMANGFNVGNTFETNQHPRTTASVNAMIDAYYNEGFRTVRIPIRWIGAGFPDGDLASNSGTVNRSHARLGVIAAVVDYALAKGMYVIINTHHDNWLFDNTWNTNMYAVHTNIWSAACDIFKNRSHKLMFEVMNEPHGSINTNSAVVRTINQNAFNVIRACGGNNATRNVIIDGQDWNGPSSLQNTWPSVTQIPGGGNDPYVIGSLHYYDPLALTHASSASGANTAWTTTSIQNAFNAVNTWANGRLPVFVGEFGVNWDQYAHSINTNTYNWFAAVASQTRSRGWAFTVWDDGGWFRVMNRSNQTFNGLQNACVP